MSPDETTGGAAATAAAGTAPRAQRPSLGAAAQPSSPPGGPARPARFGIKAKLFCALAVLAALTVVAGSVAWWIFHDMHRSLSEVAHEDMASLAEAVALVDLGGEIAATAAAVALSAGHAERERETTVLHRLQRDFAAGLERLSEVADHQAELADLAALAAGLSERTATVDAAVERSLDLAAMRARAAQRLGRAHDGLMDGVDARIDAIASDLAAGGPAAERAAALAVLMELRAAGEHAADLLREGMGTSDGDRLAVLRERFAGAASRLSAALSRLPDRASAEALDGAVERIADLGTGPEGVIALRVRELAARSEATAVLDGLREQESALGAAVLRLVESVRRESEATAARAAELTDRGEFAMIGLTLVSTLIAIGVMVLYVGRRIVRPIETITGAMTELAGGDTAVDIPFRRRGDELGRMAQALGVFRDTAIEVQESNLREIRAARRRLSDAIESISEAFSLYDADDRLVICNEKYRSLLYAGMAEVIVPGAAFADVVRQAAERGLVRDAEGRIDDWVGERLARHRDPGEAHMQQRGDGRWIMVSERRTQEGGTVAVYSDITDLKEREQELAVKSTALEQLSAQLSKYLSPQVYESIFTGRQEVKLNSRRQKLTVFFSDIAGFTETTDRMESEELTALLNHYLTEMSEIALAHGATIDKYVGDAILIFFGDPETRGVGEDAHACVRMAIAMQRRMGELAAVWRASGIGRPLQCRMGVSTGYCTVGNFGSEDRLDYTIIGGTVNLASRLESAARPGEILLSYETYALVHEEIACEELAPLTVKGLPYPVTPYRVVASRDALGREAGPIAERSDKMRLELDPEAMSEEERRQAAALLQAALDRVARRD